MTDVRITDFVTTPAIAADDYLPVDSVVRGTRKVKVSDLNAILGGRRAVEIVVGNSARDTAAQVDYLDTGDGVQLKAALAAAAAATPPKSVGVLGGTYDLAAGAGTGPFDVQDGVRLIPLGKVTLAGRVDAAEQTVLRVRSGGVVQEGLIIKVNTPSGVGTGTRKGYAVIEAGGIALRTRVEFGAFAAGFTAKLGPKMCGLSVCRGALAIGCDVVGAPSITQDTSSPGFFVGIGYGADAGASTGAGVVTGCRALPSGAQMPDAQLGILDSGGKLDVETLDGYLVAAAITALTADIVDTELDIHATWSGAATPGIGRAGVYMSASGGFGVRRTRVRGIVSPNDSSTTGTAAVQIEASGASSTVEHTHIAVSGGTWDYGAYLSPSAPATIDDVVLSGCDFTQVRTDTLTGTGATRVRLDRYEVISPAALSANTNDWAPTGLRSCSRIRLTATTPINLTGLLAQEDGAMVELECLGGSSAITIKSASGSSSAANRFAVGGTDIALTAGYVVMFVYDATTQVWRARRQPTSSGATPTAVGGTAAAGSAFALAAPIDHVHKLGFGSDTRGDLPVAGASGVYARLALGAAGTVPTSDGTDLVYKANLVAGRTVSGGSDTLATTDFLVEYSNAGAVAVSLPALGAPPTGTWWVLMIQQTDAATVVTVTPATSVDGSATLVMPTGVYSAMLRSKDGSVWYSR
jgi:hypothetical protein